MDTDVPAQQMDFAQIFRLTSGFANKPSRNNVGANLAVAVRAKQILRDRRTNKHLLQGSQSMAELAYENRFRTPTREAA